MPAEDSLIMHELRRLSTSLEKLHDKVDAKFEDINQTVHKQNTEIEKIKISSSIFGSLGGVASSIGLTLIRVLTKE